MDRSETESPELQPRQRVGTIGNYGRFRLVADLEPMEVTFLLIAFVSIVGAAIITIVRIKESENGDSDFTFAVLLLVNLIFILYYTFHGVFCERPFELLASVAATVVVLLYCVVEYAICGKNSHGSNWDLKLGRLIVICVLGPIDIVLGSIIASRFYQSKGLIFRTVGGNAALQNMCQVMFIFTAFLKFDFQLVVRYELLKLSTAFWVISLTEPAYIIYLFVRTGKNFGTTDTILRVCIIGAGVLALLIRGAVVFLSYFVTRNFNKGLKEKVYGDGSNDTRALPSEPPRNYDTISQPE
ncbi:uncharacterized protein LOC130635692 isoform X2 [Hydractinia symbiolongicarpus]|uniref:uncharacterized protein LOC130635692 isoform X2 n=1 Tax=Hydractinia symbiolongicarpus TaxID=13093 RepID=UPI0025507879|nr:uncharacterized protein LOC130635692 isoform X2 [Hydractinia symbiolongicarpus]